MWPVCSPCGACSQMLSSAVVWRTGSSLSGGGDDAEGKAGATDGGKVAVAEGCGRSLVGSVPSRLMRPAHESALPPDGVRLQEG